MSLFGQACKRNIASNAAPQADNKNLCERSSKIVKKPTQSRGCHPIVDVTSYQGQGWKHYSPPSVVDASLSKSSGNHQWYMERYVRDVHISRWMFLYRVAWLRTSFPKKSLDVSRTSIQLCTSRKMKISCRSSIGTSKAVAINARGLVRRDRDDRCKQWRP